MPIRWKDPAYNQRYGPLDPYTIQTYKVRPDLFDTDLPGPHSTTQAPTLNESTVAPASKRKSDSLPEATPPKTISGAPASTGGEAALPSSSASGSTSNMGLPGTAKEQADIGGDGASGMVYYIERPFSKFENRLNVYRKTHKFMTFGLAPNIITVESGTAPSVVQNAWLTSFLAEVPWHIPALYMNQSEFNILDPGARCVKVELEVYYRGTTIQFQTATTTTNLATLNQINDIAVAHGLNRSGQGQNVSFTSFNSTQSMIPTGVTRPKYAAVGSSYRGMIEDYYGTDNGATNFVNYIPHHQLGRQTFLYNYWAQSSIYNVGTTNLAQVQFGGWPELQDKIQQIDGKTCVNTCVAKSVYEPKQGALKAPLRMFAHGLPLKLIDGNAQAIPVGGSLPRNRVAGYSATVAGASDGVRSAIDESETDMSNAATNDVPYTLYTPIEKSQCLRSGVWGEQIPHIQPSVHIGVQPVPALTTSATLTSSIEDGSWTDVRGYWEVVATMYTKEHNPTEYPYAQGSNVPFGEVIHTGLAKPQLLLDPRNECATLGGLHSTSTVTSRLGNDIV